VVGVGAGRRVPTGREAGSRTIASFGGRVGWGQRRWVARLTPKLLILRLTTRGLDRSRRVGSRWRRSSVRVSLMALSRRSGGKAGLAGDLAADHAQRTHKRQPVGVDLSLECGLVH
jgi:hypothetical protein